MQVKNFQLKIPNVEYRIKSTTKKNRITLRRVLISTILALVITLIPLTALFLMPEQVEAAWFNDNWLYRKQIDISGNSSDLTDYQYQVTGIDTQSLYNNNQIEANCEDVRFTDLQGNLLNFWEEEDGTSCKDDSGTDFWVRVPELQSQGTTIFFYYGNRSAESYSSGSNTFEFFDSFDQWYSNDWAKRLKITVNSSQVSEQLEDFPVYVDLSDFPTDFWDSVQNDGGDIVVTASDGATKLSREVTNIDTSTDEGELWFSVPNLRSQTDMEFYVYYDNDSANETDDTDTWNSNFKLVQHMNEDPSGTAPQMLDSTSNDNDGTSAGSMATADLVDGQVGTALDLDGTDDHVSIPHSSELAFGNGSTDQPFTISAWVYMHAGNFRIFEKLDDSVYKHGWVMWSSSAGDAIHFRLYDGGQTSTYILTTRTDLGTVGLNEWVHVVGTYDGSETTAGLKIYIDGVRVGQTGEKGGSYNGFADQGDPLRIGRANWSASPYYSDGLVDEVRIVSERLTTGWIETEHSNQSDTSSFYTVGASETRQGYVLDDSIWSSTGSPEATGGSVSLTNASSSDGIDSVKTFSAGSKLIAGVTQSSTSLDSGRIGFSNTALGTSYTNDDATNYLFDSTVGNFEREATNEGTSTSAAGSIPEATTHNDFEIGWTSTTVDFRVSNSSDGSITTNEPDEASSVRLEVDSTSETLTVDWVAVASYDADPPDSQSLGTEEKSTGPILHLTFDENEGDDFYDSSQRGNDGIGVNTPSRSNDCIKGNCLSLNGSNEHIQIQDLSFWEQGDFEGLTEMTVSAWIKPSDGDSGIIGNQYTTDLRSFYMWIGSNELRFRIWDSDGDQIGMLTASDAITLNEWQHVLVAWDGTASSSGLSVYINGVNTSFTANDSGTFNGGTKDTDRYIDVGRRGDGLSYFGGQMDELKVFAKGLTEEEALAEYNSYNTTLGVDTTSTGADLAYWWRFDETTGSTAYDSTTNAEHGTLYNMEESDWVEGKIGNAVDLDGTDEEILSSALSFPNGSISISAWANADITNIGGTYQDIIVAMSDPAATGSDSVVLELDDTGHYSARIYDQSTAANYVVDAISTATVGEWTHLALTFNDSTNVMRLYVDGVLQGTDDWTAAPDFSPFTAHIGNHPTAPRYFNGQVDDVRVYKTELSIEEVRALADGPLQFNDIAVSQSFKNENTLLDYDFDMYSGSILPDRSGSNLNGTLANLTDDDWVDGYEGNALYFDGNDDYINAGTDTRLDITGSKTLSVWVKPTSSDNSYQRIISKREALGTGSSTGFEVTINPSTCNILFSQPGASGTSSINYTKSSCVDEWTHIAIQYNSGSNSYMLVDGKMVTYATMGTTVSSSNPFLIGTCGTEYNNGASGCDFEGYIDEVRVWDSAITWEEVNYEYDNGEPTAQWNFDHKSGTTLKDSSVGGHDGTLNNFTDADWTPGVIGNALYFDGADDYVNVGTDELFNERYEKTLSAWIYPTDSDNSYHRIISKREALGSGIGTGYEINLNPSSCTFIYGHTGVSPTLSYSASSCVNEWTHILVRYDGYDAYMYLNGSQVASVTVGASLSNSNPFLLGTCGTEYNNGASGCDFEGYMDGVKFWNSDIGENRAFKEYNGGAPVGWWKFDKGQGDTAYDYSGNGHDGTLSNMDPSTDWIDESECRLNRCLDFDGGNDYIIVSDSTDLRFGNNFTFTTWIKPDNTGGQVFLSKRDSGGTNYQFYYNSTFRYYDGSAERNFGLAIDDYVGSWTHLAFVVNSDDSVDLYINGNFKASVSSSTTTNDAALYIGNYYLAGLATDGHMDEVKLFAYPMSAEDVLKDYNDGAGLRFR